MKNHYFYGGPFSQWVPTKFVDENNVEYNCTEQYMMAHKALLMNDHDMYYKIMAATEPSVMKYTYGRRVKNFDAELWDRHKFDIVFKGNLFKFTQNDRFNNYIKNCVNYHIAEASPTDTIWGIGLSINDAKKGLPWRGQNLLGEVIMNVRDFILDNPHIESHALSPAQLISYIEQLRHEKLRNEAY